MVRLDFINVGYGNSVLVRDTEHEFAMLVDCGDETTSTVRKPEYIPPAGSKRILAADYLKQEGISHLDLLVITHMHRDHFFGLDAIMDAVDIDEVWANFVPDDLDWELPPEVESGSPFPFKSANSVLRSLRRYLSQLKKLEAKGIATRQITAPEMGILFTPNLRVDVYCAQLPHIQRQLSTLDAAIHGELDKNALDLFGKFLNITSLRFRLTHGARSALLPGDCYGYYWELDDPAPCNILQLPHHGCKDSAPESLLRTLRPEQVVLCTASDKPGIPGDNTIAMLGKLGIQTFWTDSPDPAQAAEAVTLEL